MSDLTIYLCRHGETAWTLSDKHTSITDIPLTRNGEKQSKLLGKRLANISFKKIFSSPLLRAKETCEIAGFTPVVDPDLQEWNYGKYEGHTSIEIHQKNPRWNLFVDGAPGGESLSEVSARADRFLGKIRELSGEIAIFSHGHFSRVLAARWLRLDVQYGKCFYVSPGSVSILGFEHEDPVIRLWNEVS